VLAVDADTLLIFLSPSPALMGKVFFLSSGANVAFCSRNTSDVMFVSSIIISMWRALFRNVDLSELLADPYKVILLFFFFILQKSIN
jgi:hypothetical protein